MNYPLERKTGHDSITQSNQLIEACYTLTLNEKRLLMLGLSQVDPRKAIRSNERLSFQVTADQWVSRFSDKNPYLMMKRAADNMMTRYITLHPKTGHTKKISWFESVEYIPGEGRIEIELGHNVSLRLAGMIDEFTRINFTSIQQLRSFHSIRLYEVVSQFRSTGYRRITIEDFRIAMDCKHSHLETKALKRYVLNPAISDINQQTDIEIISTDIKIGRKIVGFELLIKA